MGSVSCESNRVTADCERYYLEIAREVGLGAGKVWGDRGNRKQRGKQQRKGDGISVQKRHRNEPPHDADKVQPEKSLLHSTSVLDNGSRATVPGRSTALPDRDPGAKLTYLLIEKQKQRHTAGRSPDLPGA